MPILLALMLLWLGTALDMTSTYFMATHYGDDFVEVNQFFVPGDRNFYLINALLLIAFSAAAVSVLIDLSTVRTYIQETNFLTFLKEMSSRKFFRQEDFISLKVICLVSALVTVGSIGAGRLLACINNLVEFFGYMGFMRLFLSAFPVHEQVAVHTVFALSVLACMPATYVLLRLVVR